MGQINFEGITFGLNEKWILVQMVLKHLASKIVFARAKQVVRFYQI